MTIHISLMIQNRLKHRAKSCSVFEPHNTYTISNFMNFYHGVKNSFGSCNNIRNKDKNLSTRSRLAESFGIF